jgi:hypothetical protein
LQATSTIQASIGSLLPCCTGIAVQIDGELRILQGAELNMQIEASDEG